MDYFYGWIIIPMSNILGVVSMVPAGLGIRESVVGVVSHELGMGFKMGIYASTLDRLILLSWIVILGSISMTLLIFYRGYNVKKA